jgi:hypothetical protein
MSLPYGNSPDWATSLPIIVTAGLGVPLLLLAMASSRSGFFREKTVSYVLRGGALMASVAGKTVELEVAAVSVGPTVGPTP